MLHLIDRVYVEYAEAKVIRTDPRLRPESFIRIMDLGMVGFHDIEAESKNLLNAKNLVEIHEKLGSNRNFMEFLFANCNADNSKKVVIYADDISMVQLFCGLWKAIFPKITAEGAYKLYTAYKDFEYLKPVEYTTYIDILNESKQLKRSDFLKYYWEKDFAMFTRIFDTSEAFDITEAHKEKLGLEYLMIKYVLNPESDHSALYKKIDHLYKKNLMKEIHGLCMDVREYAYYLLTEDQNCSDSIYVNTLSAVDYLKDHPKYAIAVDPEITLSIKGYHHLKNNYNLIKVATDLRIAEYNIFKNTGLNSLETELDLPATGYIMNHHKEPDLKTTINEEAIYLNRYRLFRELAKKGRYNQYLVYSFAMSAKRQGFSEELSEFSE